MTPLPAAAGQLTGTQLQSVLLPESDFPSGFATPPSGQTSSGGSLTSGTATHNLKTMTCAEFVQDLGTTGFGETAMVAGAVASTAGTASTSAGEAYDQLIYQFAAPSGATAFVSGIQALAGRCASFKTTDHGQSGTLSLSASPGSPVGGHPTVQVRETGTFGSTKETLGLLLSASGVDAFGGGAVGANSPGTPSQVSTAAIVYQLMQRQAAAAELS